MLARWHRDKLTVDIIKVLPPHFSHGFQIEVTVSINSQPIDIGLFSRLLPYIVMVDFSYSSNSDTLFVDRLW